MERSDLSASQYNSLLDSIFSIIVEKGLSHTSMDYISSRLGMSKRTLYEIFESKDDMLHAMLERQHSIQKERMDHIFRTSSNAMEGLARVVKYQQEVFSSLNKSFFRDMDERFKHLRHNYNDKNDKISKALAKVVAIGEKQGVFRTGLDFQLQVTLLQVQMESLKRMEDYFPPQITLPQAYHAIAQGFLRNIATPKGIEVLERLQLENPGTDHAPANSEADREGTGEKS